MSDLKKSFLAFHVSEKGYHHSQEGDLCQDASYSCVNSENALIAVADGHGSEIYLRSRQGAGFAIEAFKDVCAWVYSLNQESLEIKKIQESIKMNFINRWNDLVDEDIRKHPLNEKERTFVEKKYNSSQFFKIYGTTFHGFYLDSSVAFSLSIGDGDTSLVTNDGRIVHLQGNSEECCGPYTHSLCESDIISHLVLTILEPDDISVVSLCTDGVMNYFSSYSAYDEFFPLKFHYLVDLDSAHQLMSECQNCVQELGKKKGTGDDVSIAILFHPSAPRININIESSLKKKV